MKKTILFGLFGGILGATSVMAANYDLYLTGSTAFRANAFTACQKLYDGGTPVSNNGTGNTNAASGDSKWTMTGTCANLGITSGGDTLTIHALWTGSVQGLSALLNKDQLGFLASATPGTATLHTNTASACFSDVFSAPTLDPLPSGSFTEKKVAVQPFVFIKSKGLRRCAIHQQRQLAAIAIHPRQWSPRRFPISRARRPMPRRTSISFIARLIPAPA